VDRAGNILADTFEGEMRGSIENLRSVLRLAGLDLRDVVQVRSYLARQDDLAEYNRLYREYFVEPFPARTTLVGCLGDILKFEIDAIAVIDSSTGPESKV